MNIIPIFSQILTKEKKVGIFPAFVPTGNMLILLTQIWQSSFYYLKKPNFLNNNLKFWVFLIFHILLYPVEMLWEQQKMCSVV